MKASIKFLSVFLVIALCLGFVPAAYAEEGTIVSAPTPTPEGNGMGMEAPSFEDPVPPSPTPEAQTSGTETATPGIGVAIPSVKTVSNQSELVSAVKDVQEGGRVILSEDVNMNTTLTISKDLTLDLGGNALKFSSDGERDYAIEIAAEVTIESGKITVPHSGGEEPSGFKTGIHVKSGSLVLDKDMTIEAEGAMITADDDATYLLYEGTYSGNPAGHVSEGEGYWVKENDDGTYTVTSEAKPRTAHEITVAVTNGTADPAGSPIAVEEGGDLSIVFAANEGFIFDSVKVDGEPAELTEGMYTFVNVTEPHSIEVAYKAQPEAPAEPEVQVDPEEDDNEIVPPIATGEPQVDPGMPGGPTIEMKDSVITVSVKNGSSDHTGENTVKFSESLTVVFTPNEGYALESVKVDGADAQLEEDGSYTFKNVIGPHSIEVTYAEQKVEEPQKGGTETTPAPEESKPPVLDGITSEDDLVAAVSVGENVSLGGDVTIKNELKVGANLKTFDLGGKTLNGKLTVEAGAVVTIKNGAIHGLITNNGTLTLEGVTAEADPGWVFATLARFTRSNTSSIVNSGVLTLEGGTSVDVLKLSSGSVTVNDASVNSISGEKNSDATITIGDGADINEIDPEDLIPTGYSQTEDGIAPMALTLPAVTNPSGTTRYDATDAGNKGNSVSYYKGPNPISPNADFVFKISDPDATVTSVSVGAAPAEKDPASVFTGTELKSGTDYTFSGGTLTIHKEATALNGLKAVENWIHIVFGSFPTTANCVNIPLKVYPWISLRDNKMNLTDAKDELTFALSDAPKSVSISPSLTWSNVQGGPELVEGVDYTTTTDGTQTVVTVKNTDKIQKFLSSSGYVVFWFESGFPTGVAVGAQVSITTDLSVSPASVSWIYSSSDVTFTVKSNSKSSVTVTGVSRDGTAIDKTQYTVKSGSVTLKGQYLASLMETSGAGNYYLVIETDSGSIGVTVTLKAPTVTIKDTDKHQSGTSATIALTVSAPATGASIDGTSVDSKYVTLSKDGKTVTLSKDILNSLNYGTHTVSVTTKVGDVSTTITVLPELTAKNGNSHRRGDNGDLPFVSGARVLSVSVGTLALTSDQYSLSSDGKTVYLSAKFLNERKVGTYNLYVTTDYGTSSTQFKITNSNGSSNNPQTGDDSNLTVWTIVLVLSGAAIVALIPKKKKQ